MIKIMILLRIALCTLYTGDQVGTALATLHSSSILIGSSNDVKIQRNFC